MGNRIIKESICYSADIDALSYMEECFYYRLLVTVDDFGVYDARPQLLKSRLFPLKTDVTTKQIDDILKKMAKIGMIVLYKKDDGVYLKICAWESHQQIRSKRSKFVNPDDDGVEMLDCNGYQMISNDIKCSPNPIQSNPNTIPIYSADARQIIDYLNTRIGSSYKATTASTNKYIKARINDGFTVDDFKTVIDKKYDEWHGTDMQKFLRPETLFGNKFESYLNAKAIYKRNPEREIRRRFAE